MPDVATVGSAQLAGELDGAAALLARSGLGEPLREAARLWAAVSGTGLGEAWLRREMPAAVETVGRFRRAVEQRAAGVPFAYAAGSVAFRTLELSIDRRALIPRPETEGLVEVVLRWSRERGAERGGLVADIGTGSGCIALALAVEGSFERVIATDASEAAAALARENVARVAPPVPVEVRVGDLVAPIGGMACRVIVSNPPYLTDQEWADLEPAVRDHEPVDALRSGPDGLAATRRLVAGARDVIEPGGLLALEVDERRVAAVRELAVAAGWRVSIHRDLFGRPRYALAV